MTFTTALSADVRDLSDADIRAARASLGAAKLAIRTACPLTRDGRPTRYYHRTLGELSPMTRRLESLRQEEERRDRDAGDRRRMEREQRQAQRAGA